MTISEKRIKHPAWTRALDIAIRTAHVAVTGILFGGAVFEVSYERIIPWYYLAVVTGCGLIASEVYHRPHWLYQGRGVMALIHIGLLGLIRLLPDLQIPLMSVVIIFGMLGSHMPKKIRYWSFIHGRVMD